MSQMQDSTSTADLVPGVWDIDPGHSNVEFVARHLVSRLRGRFHDFAGTVEIGADPVRSAAEVTIQAGSIDTHHPDRDGRLRSPDFLDVERFPTLTFRSSGGRDFDGRSVLQLDGDLTIRDVTRPVTLEVEYLGSSADPWGGTRAGFSARTAIDRDDFGAGWNMVLETGGLLVGKRVQIELEIEAVLRAE